MITLVDLGDNDIVLLKEKKATANPLAAGSDPAVVSFYVRGQLLEGWHRGQK
jgi:hypothetical protein